jgi:hypothetical protein
MPHAHPVPIPWLTAGLPPLWERIGTHHGCGREVPEMAPPRWPLGPGGEPHEALAQRGRS